MRQSHVIFSIVCLYFTCFLPSASAQCDKCKGGLSSITLQYTGALPRFVSIRDDDDSYLGRELKPGDVVKIDAADDKFDKKLTISVNFIFHTDIDVNCDKDVFIGARFGNFLIVAAESKSGGPLCCGVGTDDKIPPVIINCPSDISLNVGPSCSMPVTWQIPQAIDNCQLASFTSTHQPGVVLQPGSHTVVYTATDGSNNKTTCSFQVVIRDDIYPQWSNCPGSVSVVADKNGKATVQWVEPKPSDNCTLAEVTATHKPGAFFNIGANKVIYQARDGFGNIALCEFTVNVSRGETAPVDKLTITQMITPNGDGIADKWILQNIEQYKDNKVTVMDRWGHVVFTCQGYNNDDKQWDGMNQQSNPVPTGTYFYSVEIQGSLKTGFIELVR